MRIERRWLPALVFMAIFTAQLPLVLNPGYFSHDELQWAAYAAEGRAVPWLALDAFQYRPLTFNLWMALSRALFEWPQAFHAVMVALGALNAVLAMLLSRRLGLPDHAAAAGALVFALGPYAAYVHGWIGTLADLLWVGLGLAIGLLAASRIRPGWIVVGTVTATIAALMAKEAALSIPALLAVAWWMSGWSRRWAMAMLASGAVAAVYLALRLDVILGGAADAPGYAVGAWNVPLRWIEYQLFPFIMTAAEAQSTLARGWIDGRTLASAFLWTALLFVLWRSGGRRAPAFLLGGLAALAPALLLDSAATQYGYAFSAVTTLVAASAWASATSWRRVLLGSMAVLMIWHGINVVRHVRRVGELQAVFSPALAEHLRTHAGPPLRLALDHEPERWAYLRLTHRIPHYDGVPVGDRVRIAEPGEQADLRVTREGGLEPLRRD